MRKTIITLCLLGGAFSTAANAELIESDVNSAGDALATLDTQTGLEWLDLTETQLRGVDGTMDEAFSTVLSENSGWRLATESEVKHLVNTYLSNIPVSDFSPGRTTSVNSENLSQFRSLFGTSSTFDAHYSLGAFRTDSGDLFSAGVSTWHSGYAIFDNIYSYGSNQKTYSGAFLVSDGGLTYSSLNNENWNIAQGAADVSLPAGIGLLSLGLLAGFRRRLNQ